MSKMNSKFFKIFVVILISFLILQRILRDNDKHMEQSANMQEEPTGIWETPTNPLFPNQNFKPIFLQSGYKREEIESEGIPQIIHQIWDTYEVPERFSSWIKSWKTINPTWEHWFWSLDDARKLIEMHYSSYLSLFDSYTSSIFRADVARYFIIHQYGGVYADLDMSSILQLDNWTYPYDCILSEEPYEHSFVIREQNDVDILNGFVACKKEHPLLESAIESLEEAAGKHFGDYLRATGPMFFTDTYLKWRKIYKRRSSDQPDVVVVPPKYFFPTYDRSESDTLSTKCHPKSLKSLSLKGQVVCKDLISRSYTNEVPKGAYTDHDWLHSYMFGEDFRTQNTRHVKKIVPDIILASKLL